MTTSKHVTVLFAGLTVLVAALSACTQQKAATLPPGKYEKTTSSTDANGTTVKKQSSTEVDEDSEGNRKTVVKSKTTRDPKGLLNKTTTQQSKEVIKDEEY